MAEGEKSVVGPAMRGASKTPSRSVPRTRHALSLFHAQRRHAALNQRAFRISSHAKLSRRRAASAMA